MTAPALALAAALLAAPHSPVLAQQDQPAQAGHPGPPWDAGPLLLFLERTEDGRDTVYPVSSVLDVDVNSAILVRFSPGAFASLQHAPAAPSQARADVIRRLEDVAELQDAVNAAARRAIDADRLVAEANARGAKLEGPELKSFQAAYDDLSKVFTQLQGYMGKKAYSALVRNSDDVIAAGTGFLAKEHALLQEVVRRDLEKLPNRVITLAAYIGNPPRSVHVPGYDNLAPGEPTLVEKTRFRFDAAFESEYAAAKALASKASDWNAVRDAAAQAIREKLSEVLKQMGAVVGANPTKVAAQAGASAELKQAYERLAAEARKLQSAIADALPTVEEAVHPKDDANPALLLSNVVGALQDVAAQVRPTVQEMENVVDVLGNAKQPADLEKLSRELGKLAHALKIVDIAGAPPGAPLAPHVAAFHVSLGEARPTAISLLSSQRTEGDVLTVSMRILDEDGQTSRSIAGGESTAYFRVRSRGFVADTGAVVLFTRPVAHDPGAFVPGAGAYAVFRFKGWRRAGEANSNFWYYAAPGLGISAIAIPRTSDGSTQIAWMGTFHLFGDVLQVAAGATTDASPVWGFGIGLHRIAGIGKYFQ